VSYEDPDRSDTTSDEAEDHDDDPIWDEYKKEQMKHLARELLEMVPDAINQTGLEKVLKIVKRHIGRYLPADVKKKFPVTWYMHLIYIYSPIKWIRHM
jgi:hypothetical protein